MRLETGPYKPDGDWTGVFIRGDDAFRFAVALRALTEVQPRELRNIMNVEIVRVLIDLLASSNEDAPVCFECGRTWPTPDVFDGNRYRHVGDCPVSME